SKGAPKGGTAKKPVTSSHTVALDPTVAKNLDKVYRSISPDQAKKIKKQLNDLMGETKGGSPEWADLFALPPEKLHEMAKVGYLQFENGRYDKAEAIYRGLTILDVENYYYHSMLGAIYQRQEKWPEAMLEYSVAIDINPKDIVSKTNRGEVYYKLGLLDEARADLEESIFADPQGKDSWANRARMLMKQIETAESLLQTSLKK
ncbi:MAG: tetratricopeptide repeat protein, partial [Deltaproteobacteria bacterium]|nr:tetratricopeptide repeat protein [Deltaproteobacteria bacterium]